MSDEACLKCCARDLCDCHCAGCCACDCHDPAPLAPWEEALCDLHAKIFEAGGNITDITITGAEITASDGITVFQTDFGLIQVHT